MFLVLKRTVSASQHMFWVRNKKYIFFNEIAKVKSEDPSVVGYSLEEV